MGFYAQKWLCNADKLPLYLRLVVLLLVFFPRLGFHGLVEWSSPRLLPLAYSNVCREWETTLIHASCRTQDLMLYARIIGRTPSPLCPYCQESTGISSTLSFVVPLVREPKQLLSSRPLRIAWDSPILAINLVIWSCLYECICRNFSSGFCNFVVQLRKEKAPGAHQLAHPLRLVPAFSFSPC